jgi:hypothetical protein
MIQPAGIIGIGPGLCRIPQVNFHEKAIFVKADVAVATTVRFGYPCHASIRTLGELTLFGGSVHHEIRLFSGTLQTLPSSERSLRRETGPSSLAQSPLDPKRSGNLRLRRCSRAAVPGSSPPLLSLVAA